jgi:hypothetical protein
LAGAVRRPSRAAPDRCGLDEGARRSRGANGTRERSGTAAWTRRRPCFEDVPADRSSAIVHEKAGRADATDASARTKENSPSDSTGIEGGSYETALTHTRRSARAIERDRSPGPRIIGILLRLPHAHGRYDRVGEVAEI